MASDVARRNSHFTDTRMLLDKSGPLFIYYNEENDDEIENEDIHSCIEIHTTWHRREYGLEDSRSQKLTAIGFLRNIIINLYYYDVLYCWPTMGRSDYQSMLLGA